MLRQSAEGKKSTFGRTLDTQGNAEVLCSLPGIHSVVNEWINHSIGHGKKVESKVDVLNVRFSYNFFVVISVNEISMVW